MLNGRCRVGADEFDDENYRILRTPGPSPPRYGQKTKVGSVKDKKLGAIHEVDRIENVQKRVRRESHVQLR